VLDFVALAGERADERLADRVVVLEHRRGGRGRVGPRAGSQGRGRARDGAGGRAPAHGRRALGAAYDPAPMARLLGLGVPPARAEQLFERGWSSSDNGGGVGLAVARELVRREGGDVLLARARPACFEAVVRTG
jgi:hypothetical protein